MRDPAPSPPDDAGTGHAAGAGATPAWSATLPPPAAAALELWRRLRDSVPPPRAVRRNGPARRDEAFETALALVPYACILVEEDGRVRSLNGQARRLLGAGDGLATVDDRLVVGDEHVGRALREVLRAVARGEDQRTARLVPRPSDRPPLELLAVHVPLPASGDGPALALVVVHDPGAPLPLDLERLRSLYRLTAAEARIAERLVHGDTPRDIAARLEVSVETVRSHLKSLLSKTGCHRQAELVLRLATGIGTL